MPKGKASAVEHSSACRKVRTGVAIKERFRGLSPEQFLERWQHGLYHGVRCKELPLELEHGLVRLAQAGNKQAMDALIHLNKRTINVIANKLAIPSFPASEVEREIIAAFIRQLRNFDCNRGFRLSTFMFGKHGVASGTARTVVRDRSWLVSFPMIMRQRALSVFRAKRALERRGVRAPTPKQIASKTGLEESVVENVLREMETRLVSLDDVRFLEAAGFEKPILNRLSAPKILGKIYQRLLQWRVPKKAKAVVLVAFGFPIKRVKADLNVGFDEKKLKRAAGGRLPYTITSLAESFGYNNPKSVSDYLMKARQRLHSMEEIRDLFE